MAFDAFISYSHSADDEFAPALQKALQRFAKPWMSRRALRIFRDDAALSVNPALWESITDALDESRYFILLASPGAAQSEWVGKEIEYWTTTKPDGARSILPVLTEGTFAWDGDANDIDWAASDAAHPALAGVFTEEPRHLDFVWARSATELTLDNPQFRDAIADIAAPIHGIPKDELESEDVREHRRAIRARRSAFAGLALLLLGIAIVGTFALISWRTLGDAQDKQAAAEAAAEAASEAAAEAEDAKADAEAAAAAARLDQADAEAARAEAEAAQAEAEALQAGAVANAGRAETREIAARLREAGALERELAALDAESRANDLLDDANTALGNANTARVDAEEGALAVALATEAAAAANPATALLLASESYCATAECGGTSLVRLAISEPDLAALVPLLGALDTRQDFVRELPGLEEPVRQIATSDDGRHVAALTIDGAAHRWDPSTSAWRRVTEPDEYAIGLGLSHDGATIGVVRSECDMFPDSKDQCDRYLLLRGNPGRNGWLQLVDADSGEIESRRIDFDLRRGPHGEAEVAFLPGSQDVVLVTLDGHDVRIADPTVDPIESDNPANIPELPVFNVVPLVGLLATDDPGEAYAVWQGEQVSIVAGNSLLVFDRTGVEQSSVSVPANVTALASNGEDIVVATSDGSIHRRTWRWNATPSGHGSNVRNVALTASGAAISSGPDGSVYRLAGEGEHSIPTEILGADPNSAVLAAAAHADVVVVARGVTVLVYSGATSWSGATGWRTSDGHAFLSNNDVAGFSEAPVQSNSAGFGRAITEPGMLAMSADGRWALWEGDDTDQFFVGRIAGPGRIGLTLDQDLYPPRFYALSDDGGLLAIVANDFAHRSAGNNIRYIITVVDTSTGARVGRVTLDARFRNENFDYQHEIQIDQLTLTDTHIGLQRLDETTNIEADYLRSDTLEVYDFRSGELVFAVGGHLPDDGWSLDATQLLYAVSDGGVMRYDLDAGTTSELFNVGRFRPVSSIAAGPQLSDVVAIGFQNGGIELWDLPDRTRIGTISGHGGPVTALTFGEAGTTSLISSIGDLGDGRFEVAIRSLDADVLRRAACDAAGRDLSGNEWLQFVGIGTPLPCNRGLPE